MANLNKNIKANIEGPDQINIKLVRADLLETSNNYRMFFEICFGVFCTLAGVMLTMNPIPIIYWVFAGLMLLGCGVFIYLSAETYKKAKKSDC